MMRKLYLSFLAWAFVLPLGFADDRCTKLLYPPLSVSVSATAKLVPDHVPALDRKPHTLAAIRELIEREGLYTVVVGKKPADPNAVLEMELMTGTKVIYAGDVPRMKGQVTVTPGVLLHSGDYEYEKLDHILGSLNLHTPKNSFDELFADKISEYATIERYAPGVMPLSKVGSVFVKTYPKLADAQKAIQTMIAKRASAEALRGPLTEYITTFFKTIETDLTGNAYLKLGAEFKTGDMAKLVTTNKTKPAEFVGSFLDSYKRQLGLEQAGREAQSLQKQWQSSRTRNISFVANMVYAPEKVLVQKAVDPEFSLLGEAFEMRVDVLGGVPVRPMIRHTDDYLTKADAEQAKQFVRSILDRLPPEMRSLSGGFDVMKLKNGKMSLIETNAGSNSGFMIGSMLPVETNLGISELIGRPTPLIRRINEVYSSPLEKQVEFLKAISSVPPPSAEASAFAGQESSVLYELRKRYVEDWLKNPTEKGATVLLAKIRKLAEPYIVRPNPDVLVLEVVKSTELFLNKVLESARAH